MTESGIAAQGGQAVGAEESIDFSRYQTTDLVERFVELISVPRALRSVLKTGTATCVLVLLAYSIVLYLADVSLVPTFLVAAYGMVTAVACGVLLGICRVLLTVLTNLESILPLVVKLTADVAADYRRLQSGEARVPPAGEIVEHVYGRILVPAMERAVSSSFGMLSKPVHWAYRLTIGTAIRTLVKRVARTRMANTDETLVTAEAEQVLGHVAGSAATVEDFTSGASPLLERIGRTIRRLAILPLYAGLILALIAVSAPLIVVAAL